MASGARESRAQEHLRKQATGGRQTRDRAAGRGASCPVRAEIGQRWRAVSAAQWLDVAYFTVHPYGRDVGTLTGLPAIASVSAAET